MINKRYTKKDLVPIKYKLSITRNELVELLDMVRLRAESYELVDIFDLAKKFIEDKKLR